MKAQTRHQLRTNELADALTRGRLFVEQHGWRILIGVGLLVAIVLAIVVWRSNRAQAVDTAWQRVLDTPVAADAGADAGNTITELRELAGSSDTPLARVAKYKLGSALLHQTDSVEARDQRVEEAVRLLRQVFEDPETPAHIAAPAGFALATAYEEQRDFENARTTYQAVATNERFAGSPYQVLAVNRSTTLEIINTQVPFVPGGPPPPASMPATAEAATPEAMPSEPGNRGAELVPPPAQAPEPPLTPANPPENKPPGIDPPRP